MSTKVKNNTDITHTIITQMLTKEAMSQIEPHHNYTNVNLGNNDKEITCTTITQLLTKVTGTQ